MVDEMRRERQDAAVVTRETWTMGGWALDPAMCRCAARSAQFSTTTMSADDTTTRPLKRARLSPEADNSSSPLHPSPAPSALSLAHLDGHPEFWFDDGNIILIAQQTGFRIFRGLLAVQSTVFADMFAAASSQPDETLDGCPVVHLTDSPLDLAHLLRILLPASPVWCVFLALDLNGFHMHRLQLSYFQI